MLLDSLTHITPDGRWFNTSYDASEARLLREMDAAGIQAAVVAAIADHIDNDFVWETCARHAPRLVAGAGLNPVRSASPAEAATAARQLFQTHSFRILKLHPRLNRFDPLDERVLAVLEEVAGCSRPPLIWLDTLLYSRDIILRKPLVDTLHHLAVSFPNLTFVLLHAGGAWALSLAEALRSCNNAYLDLSFTLRTAKGSSVWNDLAYLGRTFDRRMIWGSDFPEIAPGEALGLFEELAAGLTAQQRANILARNLARLLELELA